MPHSNNGQLQSETVSGILVPHSFLGQVQLQENGILHLVLRSQDNAEDSAWRQAQWGPRPSLFLAFFHNVSAVVEDSVDNELLSTSCLCIDGIRRFLLLFIYLPLWKIFNLYYL